MFLTVVFLCTVLFNIILPVGSIFSPSLFVLLKLNPQTEKSKLQYRRSSTGSNRLWMALITQNMSNLLIPKVLSLPLISSRSVHQSVHARLIVNTLSNFILFPLSMTALWGIFYHERDRGYQLIALSVIDWELKDDKGTDTTVPSAQLSIQFIW